MTGSAADPTHPSFTLAYLDPIAFPVEQSVTERRQLHRSSGPRRGQLECATGRKLAELPSEHRIPERREWIRVEYRAKQWTRGPGPRAHSLERQALGQRQSITNPGQFHQVAP